MLAAAWGSPLIVEDKVYVGDEDGDVAIFRHSADPKVAMEDDMPALGEINMGNSVYSHADRRRQCAVHRQSYAPVRDRRRRGADRAPGQEGNGIRRHEASQMTKRVLDVGQCGPDHCDDPQLS